MNIITIYNTIHATTTMSAFTETTHDNSAVCEQKSAAAAAERVRLSSATKQATSKQDFAIAGVSESGKWHFCIAADGHGRTSKTIDYLRSRNWSTLIDHKSLQCLITILREDIGKLKGTNDGACLSIVRFTDHKVISGGHGDCGVEPGIIELCYIGDSSIKIYSDNNVIYKSKDHDRYNKEEIERISETCNMRGIQRSGQWDIEVVNSKLIKSVPAAIFDFGGGDAINMTNALGHEGKTGDMTGYYIMQMDNRKNYKIVVATDGFWGMTCDHDQEFISGDSDANALVDFADSRWRQTWNHNNTYTIVKNIKFPTSNIDDICASVALIKLLVL